MPRPSMSARLPAGFSASPWRALWAPAPLLCGPLYLLSSLFPLDRGLAEMSAQAPGTRAGRPSQGQSRRGSSLRTRPQPSRALST